MSDPLSQVHYTTRRNFFSFLHQWFRVLDSDGNIVFFTKMRAFKLKEDFRILAADKQTELIQITARQILDIAATYDVNDLQTGERLGSFRRKGLKSIFKDEWIIFDAADNEIGLIQEDSGALAFTRRFIGNITNLFAPQRHIGTIGGNPVLVFRQTRNPFIMKTYLDFAVDTNNLLDRRLGIAASVLFCAIEGKQG